MVIVDKPDTTAVAFGLFDQRLCEHAEEALEVGLTYQQVERELNDLRLHFGAAFRTATFVSLANQCGAKHFHIV